MAERDMFREVVGHHGYQAAIDILLESEDRSTRGYTMARAALALTQHQNDTGVQIGDAVDELLAADDDGLLRPPLSDELKSRLTTYQELEEGRHESSKPSHHGLGALLLSQAVTHGHSQQVAGVTRVS